MNHPSDTPIGPADLALPLALAARSAATDRRAPEFSASTTVTTGRGRRAARRRAATVRG
ncbi:hypothetical protein ACIA8E_23340 [Streptomyces sp. NPDC051664]|uniref:hypothetical protein n=1 Tax=Streptomyces sp. NPDC051664 TaxID=3365668 RepID=UPI0037A8268D